MDTIKTKLGEIQGVDMGEYVEYRGIPYAKPPVGDLRWKVAQPVEPWEGVLKSDTFPPKCPQDETFYGFFKKEFYSNPDFLPPADEDCLYLNIWTPKTAETALPVAFWIHGGGFGGGWGAELEFDGSEYCRRGVILVTINYRVNIYGYLAHPWLSNENELGISGNYGLSDQIAALRWVHENIQAFGGDPKNITAFGQSAGCMSVQNLISSRQTGNIISKAILQSGAVYKNKFLFTPTLEEEMVCGEEFVSFTGANNIAELRALTTEQIAEARNKYSALSWKKGKGIIIVPNVDGYMLDEPVTESFAKGNIKDIPYMIGTVAEEIGLEPGQGTKGIKSPFYYDSMEMSLHLEKQGRNPAYVYYFTHKLPGDDNGAFHSAELWYMFGTLKRSWRPMEERDYKISEKMLDCWTNFMKTGKPDQNDEWRPCTSGDTYVQIFD